MYIRYLYSIEPTYFFIWFQRFHPTASCIVCHQNAKKGKTKNLLQIIWQIIRSTFSHYLQCWDNTPHSCGICTTKKVWKRKILCCWKSYSILLSEFLSISSRLPTKSSNWEEGGIIDLIDYNYYDENQLFIHGHWWHSCQ